MIRFSIVSLFMIFFSWSQGQEIANDSIPKSYLIIGDTIANSSISLSEVIILPKLKFNNFKCIYASTKIRLDLLVGVKPD